jgi:anti-sigma regulatory factor (Ser/Thr protein kinase)
MRYCGNDLDESIPRNICLMSSGENVHVLHLPKRANFHSVSQMFSDLRAEPLPSSVVIEIETDGFITVDGMAYLTAECFGLQSRGTSIALEGDKSVVRYLERMDFQSHLGIEAKGQHRHSEKGRFLPIKLIRDGDDVFAVVNSVCDLVLSQFDDAKRFIPAMEWAVNELIDNIIIHAESPVPGVVCAQFYPALNKLEVAICDMGRGIKESLSTGHDIKDHRHALERALERGVTRDTEVGQGNGMAGSLEICRANEGDFLLWSGDAEFYMKAGEPRGVRAIPEVRGTGIFLSLHTDKPVDLAKTWIAGGDWGFIEATAQRLSEGEGIDVAKECANTGSRPPGKYLRRKIAALLPEMDGPLTLNFENVRSASSSFLDELLGRLAKEFGTEVFQAKIQLIGMSETIRKMANVVVAQRTGEIELPNSEQKPEKGENKDNAVASRNAWLVRIGAMSNDEPLSIELPFTGALFEGVREGDGLILECESGEVAGFARLFRKRCGLEETWLYFDSIIMLESRVETSSLGLTVGNGEEVALRQDWAAFEEALSKAGIGKLESLPKVTGRSAKERSYLRELLQLGVLDDLLGPAMGPEEEIIGMGVRDRYLVGKLAPKTQVEEEAIEGLQGQTALDEETPDGDVPDDLRPHQDQRHEPGEEFASAKGSSDPDDDESQEIDASKNQSFVPSSVGLTVCVDGSVESLDVEVRWGRYQRFHDHEHYVERRRKNKKTGEYETVMVKERVWKRLPSGGTTLLTLKDGLVNPIAPDPACPQVLMQGTVRPPLASGDRLVTLFLLNDQPEPAENQDEAWLFQPEIILRDPEGRAVFRRRPVLGNEGHDPERESLEMIYRDRVEFAVGHSVSVRAEPSSTDPKHAVEIRTSVMPEYEVAVTETPGLDEKDRPAMRRMVDDGFLDMENLAGMDRTDLTAALSILTDDYETWIGEQRDRIGADVVGYDTAASEALDRCDEILDRLREGVDVLKTDDKALEAFRFANLAMATQRVRSIYALSRRRGDDVKLADLDIRKNRSWRPFQLAFILLSIPAIADPKHKDRTKPVDSYADLLWFPTGGGKTEAYLGVAAFTMAVRRIQGDLGGLDGSRGLAVIMRYTLRLLTLQQFQRATALICAMEVLRRADQKTWGKTPFTIGLWVGQKVTPNDTEASHASIEAERAGKRPTKSSPAQLTSCPWCGSEIAPGRDIEVRRFGSGTGQTVIYCGDKLSGCDFSRAKSKEIGLPVQVVDEEIYRRPPSMLIATVDKFAMMAWRGQVRTLFGRVTQECPRHGWLWPGADCSGKHQRRGALPATKVANVKTVRPPDLIIQDEFHLISGPLGTMVGLYETAVDELATWKIDDKEIKPKVIASTATVRKAAEQVNNVFLRRVSVFPPHGLDVEDNFFSVQRPIDQIPGRRYLGICSPGSARPAVLIRVYTALLTAAQELFGHFGAAVDPYMSVVGYFNSLRELGGMRRLAEDDVQTRSYRVQMSSVARPGLAQRSVKNVDELTSRVSSKEIPKKLDHLEVSFKGAVDPETGLYKVAWKKGEAQAIDVVLATNMLSVGVDVNRLGLMAVNGQPKSTAEYIQATSRVGRFFPGLVCTVLTWTRPRDLSHYETFEHYHATFYKHVEAQSVTPFAPRALDRGLTGSMLSWLRLSHDEFNPNLGAGKLDKSTRPEIAEAKSILSERGWQVTSLAEVKLLAELMIGERCDEWVKEANRGGRRLGYEPGKKRKKGEDDIAGLLKKPGLQSWDIFTVPMSLREVEPGVRLVMNTTTLPDGPAWRPKPTETEESGDAT